MSFKMKRAALAASGILALCGTAARADFIDMWANKTDSPQNKAPPRGHSKLLVIPVEINYTGPNGAYPAVDHDKLDAFFNPDSIDVNKFTFPSFLRVASNNRFAAEVTVAPTVKYEGCPVALAGSADCDISRGDITALQSGMDFVRDVFRRAHDEYKVDFSKFDGNGLWNQPDGYADGVMMLVNVPGVGIAFPIAYLNNGSNLNGSNGGPFVLDGVKIPYVAIGGVQYFGGAAHLETVIVHEFGHVLGLADLYNEHPSVNDPYPEYEGLHYSTMGDWGYDDSAIIPDAESRRVLGWQDTQVISGTQTLTLKPAAAGGKVVKMGMMDASGRQEYFLAEVRGPSGAFDKGIVDGAGNPTWGLAVYHVDWAKGPLAANGMFTKRLLDCLDCDAWHPFIRNLESANHFGLIFSGATSGQRSTGFADDQILFQTSSVLESLKSPGVLSATNRYTGTNWYDGTFSGISISNVQVNSDHSVTATFTAPFVENACADVVCAPLEECVTNGPTAGSCAPIGDLPADAGLPFKPAPVADTSGCSTAPGTTSSALWMLPLIGLLGLAVRRQRKA
ncbi:MAG: hypothetical protein JST92_04140 [Deltaproteobacteria bacterium]|nr:hypothetical protein [Deltaproteobacteria bacterium]